VLLCTPLRNRDIVRANGWRCGGYFFWPWVVYLSLNVTPFAFLVARNLSAAEPAYGKLIGAAAAGLALIGWLTLSFVADVAAAGWLGILLGLNARKPKPRRGDDGAVCVNFAGAIFFLYAGILVADFFLILWRRGG